MISANCIPVDDTYQNDDDDYMSDTKDESDYGDYDETSDDKKSTTASSSDATTEAYKTEEMTQIVEAGKSATLQCKTDTIPNENTVFLWYNGSSLIVSGKPIEKVRDIITFSKKDGSLTIKNVDMYDDADYRCRVYPQKERIETKIILQVNGAPKSILIGHNQKSQKNVAGQILNYTAGEKDLRFRCNVGKSRPEAKIAWNHNGNAIQESKDHDIRIIDSEILQIKILHTRHAGEYQCEASNEYGTVKANFNIDVQCKLSYNLFVT